MNRQKLTAAAILVAGISLSIFLFNRQVVTKVEAYGSTCQTVYEYQSQCNEYPQDDLYTGSSSSCGYSNGIYGTTINQWTSVVDDFGDWGHCWEKQTFCPNTCQYQ